MKLLGFAIPSLPQRSFSFALDLTCRGGGLAEDCGEWSRHGDRDGESIEGGGGREPRERRSKLDFSNLCECTLGV